jgi:hypothetical protein
MRTLADPDRQIHQPSLLNADLGTSIPGLISSIGAVSWFVSGGFIGWLISDFPQRLGLDVYFVGGYKLI